MKNKHKSEGCDKPHHNDKECDEVKVRGAIQIFDSQDAISNTTPNEVRTTPINKPPEDTKIERCSGCASRASFLLFILEPPFSFFFRASALLTLPRTPLTLLTNPCNWNNALGLPP